MEVYRGPIQKENGKNSATEQIKNQGYKRLMTKLSDEEDEK
jgi:hypothetical protein